MTKNFLLYAQQVLERNGKETTEEKIESYRPLVEQQLATIEKQAQIAYENLTQIKAHFLWHRREKMK